MARTVTLANLKEAIRVRADLPTFSTTTFVTTSAVNSMVNESLQSLYAILIEAAGDEYFAYSTQLSTTANVGVTSLPSRCIKVLNVWWERGTDDVVRVQRGNADDLVLASYASKSWTEYCPKFRLYGTSSIKWLPTPNAVYTVQVDHVALPADLSADGDTFEAGMNWEQFVIADVCSKIAQREEKDPSIYMAERANAEARIRAQAVDRLEGDPLVLRDVTSGGLSAYALRNILTSKY